MSIFVFNSMEYHYATLKNDTKMHTSVSYVGPRNLNKNSDASMNMCLHVGD